MLKTSMGERITTVGLQTSAALGTTVYVLHQEHSANTCDGVSRPKRIADTVYYADTTEQTANHAVLNILRAIKVKITLTSMWGTTG